MRLIDADALSKAFSEDIDTDVCQTFADYLSEWGFSHDTVERAITDAPTIEAEPVRHGRWVVTKEYNDVIDMDVVKYACSACGEYRLSATTLSQATNYCPNCGAKMDGDNHE